MASSGLKFERTAAIYVSIDNSGSTAIEHPDGRSTLDFSKDFTMRLVKQALQEARALRCKLSIGVLAFDDSARVLFFRSADDPDLLANLEACLGPLRPEGLTSFAAAAQGWMDYMNQPEVIGLLKGATPTVELHDVITDGRDSSSLLPKWEASDITVRQCVFVVTTVYGDARREPSYHRQAASCSRSARVFGLGSQEAFPARQYPRRAGRGPPRGYRNFPLLCPVRRRGPVHLFWRPY